MVRDTFEKLGGAVVVSALMNVDYATAWRWEKTNFVPAHRRLDFIAACGHHGVTVTLQQLASDKK